MNVIDTIENAFSKATFAVFFPSEDRNKHPSIVVISFEVPQGQEEYNLLLDNYQNNELTLVVSRNNKRLDLSIVDKQTADCVNIRGLGYRESELTEFISSEPADTSFVFVIAYRERNAPRGVNIIATRKPFKPLVVGRYTIL